MTQEEKQRLLKDLCSRLPYGVIVKATYKDGDGWKNNDRKLLGVYQHDGQVYLDGVYTTIDKVKLYLRPMSSMTEEEKKEDQYITERWMYDADYSIADSIDWLNAHHFDYRGLIEKGLAIEVPKGMYNT